MTLTIYNKPTITYRIEGFSFFIINAWELLLKARLIETSGNEKVIYYKKSRGQERRSLSIEDCLKRVFPEDNPVKKNLDSITKIRNAATHFLVEELEVIYTGLFQSAVLNYVTYLAQWFSLSITDRCSPAMLSLFTDVKDIDSVKLKKKYDPYILEFIQSEQERLTKTRTTENSIEYSIPIDYKLALVKSPGKADIVLSKGLDGDKMGIIIEVPKDVNETHPLIQKGVVEEVKKRLPSVPFNNYDFQAIVFKEKIKSNPKFHYLLQKPEVHKYSMDLVDFIVAKTENDDKYLSKARNAYSASKKSKT